MQNYFITFDLLDQLGFANDNFFVDGLSVLFLKPLGLVAVSIFSSEANFRASSSSDDNWI